LTFGSASPFSKTPRCTIFHRVTSIGASIGLAGPRAAELWL
jgi:hypothetical protein